MNTTKKEQAIIEAITAPKEETKRETIKAKVLALFTEMEALHTYWLSAIDNRTMRTWRIEFKAISDETAKATARAYRAGRPDLSNWRLQRPH